MASELKRVGWYRLLYYQPAPETGERITIGLLFEDEGHAFLHYDKQFAKLRKLYPWIDSKTVGFYLEDLKSALSKAKGIDPVLNLYGPQLVSSDARKVVLPITDALVKMLMGKFVQPAPRGPQHLFREALAELAVKTPANAPDPPPSTQPPDAAPEAAGGQRDAITEGFTSLGPDSSAKAVISALCSTRNESEWNTICDAVKRNGQYPPWWFANVIVTNLPFTQRTRWEKRQSAL